MGVGVGDDGSADLAAFNTARQVAINEIAKVTSSPGLSGTLSDSARHEVEAFIPENATLAQVLAVAKTLRADMKNRHESLDEQIRAIQKRIGGGGKQAQETPPAPAPPSGDAMIDVQIPGQPPGKIHASQWEAFHQKYPNATKK